MSGALQQGLHYGPFAPVDRPEVLRKLAIVCPQQQSEEGLLGVKLDSLDLVAAGQGLAMDSSAVRRAHHAALDPALELVPEHCETPKLDSHQVAQLLPPPQAKVSHTLHLYLWQRPEEVMMHHVPAVLQRPETQLSAIACCFCISG